MRDGILETGYERWDIRYSVLEIGYQRQGMRDRI